MRRFFTGGLVVVGCVVSTFFLSVAHARLPEKISNALHERYPPATWHEALAKAYEHPDPEKLRGFVKIKKEGIPAEQARYFISWQEYEYRWATVRDGIVKTRKGKPHVMLQPGDVMAVVSIESFWRTISLRLISPDVYIPNGSRVTVEFGVQFPKKVFKEDDVDTVLKAFGEWLEPVQDPRKKSSRMPASVGSPISTSS